MNVFVIARTCLIRTPEKIQSHALITLLVATKMPKPEFRRHLKSGRVTVTGTYKKAEFAPDGKCPKVYDV